MPAEVSSFTTWKRFLTSSLSSTADGSSMMISLMSCDSARAMLTICLFAALSWPTSVLGDRLAWPEPAEAAPGSDERPRSAA